MLSTLDWSYLNTPGEARTEYYEHLKRMHLHGDWVLDIGGQYRHQFKADNRRTMFTGAVTSPRSDTFSLNRTRLYFNVYHQDGLRGYIEYFDGSSFNEDLPPLPIDVNR